MGIARVLCVVVVCVSIINAQSTTPQAAEPSTVTSLNTTTIVSQVCADTIDTCSHYGRQACTQDVYRAWAQSHCALYCGFCTPKVLTGSECENKLTNCEEYDNGLLCTSQSYYIWAYENCRGYCQLDHCTNSTAEPACEDDPNVDCTSLDIAYNFCDDIKAKNICRKHCNLCNVTDGAWSPWTAYGACNVTCGSGTEERTRTCTNPAPSNGGANCNGDETQSRSCQRDPCPVNGGWGTWTSWSTCSATCDVGMQRRDRSCDNPRPAMGGEHCFGDGLAYQLCKRSPCHGNVMSAFTATNLLSATVSGTVRFDTVLLNEGNDYSSSTGVFTCQYPGFYHFTVSLTKKRGSGTDLIECHLSLNNIYKIKIHVDPHDDADSDYGSYSASASATFHLHHGDTVNLMGCSSASHFDSLTSMFSGFLIKEDV